MTTPARNVEPPPYRDFDEEPHDYPKVGPVFSLGGEEFHCVPMPPGGVLPRLMMAVRVDDRGRQIYNNPDILLFMEDVMAEELPVMKPNPAWSVDATEGTPEEIETWEPCDDVARWNALMFDKKRPQELDRIGRIMLWLTEVYTGRPISPSAR